MPLVKTVALITPRVRGYPAIPKGIAGALRRPTETLKPLHRGTFNEDLCRRTVDGIEAVDRPTTSVAEERRDGSRIAPTSPRLPGLLFRLQPTRLARTLPWRDLGLGSGLPAQRPRSKANAISTTSNHRRDGSGNGRVADADGIALQVVPDAEVGRLNATPDASDDRCPTDKCK
jgi:hypothetical protein